jgi:hypothetical protein
MLLYFKGINMFFVPINIPSFVFSPSKKFLLLLVPQKFSINVFSPTFKFSIVLNFLTKNKLNINYMFLVLKNSHLIHVLLTNSNFFCE